jgi:hypothetical protein
VLLPLLLLLQLQPLLQHLRQAWAWRALQLQQQQQQQAAAAVVAAAWAVLPRHPAEYPPWVLRHLLAQQQQQQQQHYHPQQLLCLQPSSQ